jgi:predicted Zn-dependent peptidase
MPAKKVISHHFDKLKLKSGVTILTVPIPHAQSTTVMALVNAGPRYDPVDKSGLSHLIEHLKIRTKSYNRKSDSLLRRIANVGSTPRGFTYYETNKYWINVVPEYCVLGVTYLCKILNDVNYSYENISTEKHAVLEEMRIIDSNPEKKIWELWSRLIFHNHPLWQWVYW